MVLRPTRIREYQADPRRAQQPGPPPTQPTPHTPNHQRQMREIHTPPLTNDSPYQARTRRAVTRSQGTGQAQSRESERPRVDLGPALVAAAPFAIAAPNSALPLQTSSRQYAPCIMLLFGNRRIRSDASPPVPTYADWRSSSSLREPC